MDATYIDANKAPRPLKKPTTKRGQVSQQLITGLTKGKVLQVPVRSDQTPRGIKVSLVRAAKSLNKSIDIWDIDGIVYAELTDD